MTDTGRRRFLIGAGMGMLALGLPPIRWLFAAEAGQSVSRAELARLLKEEFDLPDPLIQDALNEAHFQPSVIERMNRPYEARPYVEYRPLFVHPRLAKLGHEYMAQHADIFASAWRQYGVQKEIIAAILGMETHFGRSVGKDRVLDSLFTLASGYPRRATFFRKELGHFLKLCQEESLSFSEPIGSYAGAFGTTQFIPSSFRGYAVDADGDGRRDVWNSPTDIIHSVAHYFYKHHWNGHRPVAYWLDEVPTKPALKKQRELELKDWTDVQSLNRAGLPAAPPPWQTDDKVSLADFDTAEGLRTALIHRNFYVITRWNRSNKYAMAVTELAEMLGCELCRTQA
jgi:membrane-bound lytic murein transglycosylase B